MAAKIKKEEKIISPVTDDDEVEEAAPVAIQRHRIVTEYKKTVPIGDLDAAEDEGEPEPEEVEAKPERAEEPPDSMEKLLADMGASASNWVMVVDRLPNYYRDGASHTRAKFTRCGILSLTYDYLKNEEYISDIQTRWARPNKPNDFRLIVRRDGKIYRTLEVLSLEPPDPETIASVESAAPQINVNVPQSDNSLDALIKNADKLNRLREAMGWNAPSPAAAPAKTQEITTEQAVLKIANEDGSLVKQVVENIAGALRSNGGGLREEPSILEIVFKAVENNTIPAVVREIGAWFKPANVQPQPAPQPEVAEPPLDQTPASSETQQPLTIEMAMLAQIVHYCGMQSSPKAVASFTVSSAKNNPDLYPHIDMFLSMQPGEAIGFIEMLLPDAAPIVRAPHASQWILDLQAALRDEMARVESEDD